MTPNAGCRGSCGYGRIYGVSAAIAVSGCPSCHLTFSSCLVCLPRPFTGAVWCSRGVPCGFTLFLVGSARSSSPCPVLPRPMHCAMSADGQLNAERYPERTHSRPYRERSLPVKENTCRGGALSSMEPRCFRYVSQFLCEKRLVFQDQRPPSGQELVPPRIKKNTPPVEERCGCRNARIWANFQPAS